MIRNAPGKIVETEIREENMEAEAEKNNIEEYA
jgi:hypothetical protein